MKRISVFLASLLLFFHSSLQAYSTNPKDFVNELVNEAIGKLADKDLELRGPGEFFGLRQSGFLNFKIADLVKDKAIIQSLGKQQ